MNNNLYVFKQDKIKYESQLQVETNEFAKQKLTRDFQDKVKRYLGLAIKIINDNFNIDYSINKEADGLDSSFHKIKSIARKTDAEILTEMTQLELRKDSLNVDEQTKENIELAIEVVRLYCVNGSSESVEIPPVMDVDVFNDNKKVTPIVDEKVKQIENDNDSEKNYDEVVKGYKKDSPFIIYKILLGIVMIPVICIFLSSLIYTVIYNFEKTSLYTTAMNQDFIKDNYNIILNVLYIIIGMIGSGFFSAFIKGRTNNQITFAIIPFVIYTVILYLSSEIVKLILTGVPQNIILYILNIYSVYMIVSYAFILFFYISGIFKKHAKTSIVEIINLIVLCYILIIPSISLLVGLFNTDLVKTLTKLYNYPSYNIVLYILSLLCIISNIIFIIIKNNKLEKKENETNKILEDVKIEES